MEKKTLYKTLELSTSKYFITHLYLVNGVLPVKLTEREIEIIAYFLELGNTFSTNNRKKVRENLNLSYGALSNHLKNLKNKGVIVKKGEDLKVHDVLIPSKKEQEYNFKLINKDEAGS